MTVNINDSVCKMENQKYEIWLKYGTRITHENKTGKIIVVKMSKVSVLFGQRKVTG